MKSRLLFVLTLLLLFNLALVAGSAFLAVRSTQHYPRIGQLIEVDGVQLHILDSGPPTLASPPTPARAPIVESALDAAARSSASAIVLIHGASTSLLDFETAIKPYLTSQARVISIDRPGHGYSERGADKLIENIANGLDEAKQVFYTAADDARSSSASAWMDPARQAQLIAGALTTLDVDKAVWVGHSWAGSVVLAGLLSDTFSVEAGVLIAGATHPWEGAAAWHVELAATPLLGAVFSWQYIEPVGRWLMPKVVEQVFAPEPVPENYIDDTGLVLSLRPGAFQHNAQDLTRLSRYLENQWLRYPTIAQPLLSITGSDDNVVPPWNHDQRLAEQVPHLQSIQLPGAGHALHHTRSREVAELIIDFIDQADIDR